MPITVVWNLVKKSISKESKSFIHMEEIRANFKGQRLGNIELDY